MTFPERPEGLDDGRSFVRGTFGVVDLRDNEQRPEGYDLDESCSWL
jgi:hypothetical protein